MDSFETIKDDVGSLKLDTGTSAVITITIIAIVAVWLVLKFFISNRQELLWFLPKSRLDHAVQEANQRTIESISPYEKDAYHKEEQLARRKRTLVLLERQFLAYAKTCEKPLKKSHPEVFRHRGFALFWISLSLSLLVIPAMMLYIRGLYISGAKTNYSGLISMIIGGTTFILLAFLYAGIDYFWVRTVSRSAFLHFFANAYNETTGTILNQSIDDQDLNEKLDSENIFKQFASLMKNYEEHAKWHDNVLPVTGGAFLGLPVTLLFVSAAADVIKNETFETITEIIAFVSLLVGTVVTSIFLNQRLKYPPHNLTEYDVNTNADESTNVPTQHELQKTY